MMELGPKIWGAIIGGVATLAAAVLTYLMGEEKLHARIADDLRDDLHRQWKKERDLRVEAEQREEAAKQRADEAEERVEKLEQKVDGVREDLEEYREIAEETHQRYDRLAARIEQDSDIDWDPMEV